MMNRMVASYFWRVIMLEENSKIEARAGIKLLSNANGKLLFWARPYRPLGISTSREAWYMGVCFFFTQVGRQAYRRPVADE